jgi:hypothetical protein
MFDFLRHITKADLIIGAFMIALILYGSYMSYRPHRVPAPAASAPVTLSIAA